MSDLSYWNEYREFMTQLTSELPEAFVPVGDFIVIYSPVIMLLVVFFGLIDKLFERKSAKFLAQAFVKLCKFMWDESFKEPEHKGLISEASTRVQKAFHGTAAWFHGVLGLILFLFTLIAAYPLLTVNIRPDKVIEGTIVLIALTAASLFFTFIQFGLSHQAIKLRKSLEGIQTH